MHVPLILNATGNRQRVRFILSITSGNKILNELYELFPQKSKSNKSAALYWPGGGCSMWCCGDDFRSLPKTSKNENYIEFKSK